MDREIKAMAAIAEALDAFEEGEAAAVSRILQWATSRYGGDVTGQLAVAPTPGDTRTSKALSANTFDDIADLFHVASPGTAPERALVVGYWVTVYEVQAEFTAQIVNSKLKDLGYGVANITDAFTTLMRRKPSLVMQTAKQGKSRQARKRYKLTRAGLDEVERLIRSDPEPGG